jgi:hypothetical protein
MYLFDKDVLCFKAEMVCVVTSFNSDSSVIFLALILDFGVPMIGIIKALHSKPCSVNMLHIVHMAPYHSVP